MQANCRLRQLLCTCNEVRFSSLQKFKQYNMTDCWFQNSHVENYCLFVNWVLKFQLILPRSAHTANACRLKTK